MWVSIVERLVAGSLGRSLRRFAADADTSRPQQYNFALWEQLRTKIEKLKESDPDAYPRLWTTCEHKRNPDKPLLTDQVPAALALHKAVQDLTAPLRHIPSQTHFFNSPLGHSIDEVVRQRSLAGHGERAWKPVSARTAARYQI